MVPCRAPRLRGRHRGRRPSGPDPGNAGGGNVNEQRSGYDVVIVGGGVIGLSCAWRAARRGARVVVVERSQPPARAEAGVAPGALAAAVGAAVEAGGMELLTETGGGGARYDGAGIAGGGTEGGGELRAAAIVPAAGAWWGQAEWLPESARPPVR